ncbi:hypothetical protein N9P15_07075 [Planktomarina sp.]|nr:hypothetical protein [Planktomarina sp.]
MNHGQHVLNTLYHAIPYLIAQSISATRTRAATSDSPLVCGDIGWAKDDSRLLWAIPIIQICI